MSDRLAISATLSVLLMAGYALLGTGAPRMELGPQALTSPAKAVAVELPRFDRVLTLSR
ncbi:MAG TPA: hypothetical protein VGE05_07705 [Novosphingobium sp.]